MASKSQDHAGVGTAAPSAGQLVALVVLGILLWFAAALLIRALQPFGALHAPGVWLTYALVVPGTLPFVLLIRRVARLSRAQTGEGVAVVTAVATLCDANALLWFPALYGPDPLGGAVAVLWGAGVALLLGVAKSR